MAINKLLKLAGQVCSIKLGLPYPFSAAIDLTDVCNSKCLICRIWAKEKKFELSPEIFRERFQRSRVLKRLKVFNFGGGEPFLMDNLDKFVRTVVDFADPIQVRFVTNGFDTNRIGEIMKALLMDFDVKFGIKLSIDGFGDTHNRIRRVADGFAKAMKTLDLLCRYREEYPNRLSINIGFTTTSINFLELEKVHKLCIEKEVGFFHKPVLNPDKFCEGNFDDGLLLNDRQKEEVAQYTKRYTNNLNGFSALERNIYRSYYSLQNRYMSLPHRYMPCYASRASFYLTPDGEVTPCLLLNESLGNFNDAEFDELWFSEKAELLRRKVRDGSCHCLTSCDTFPSLLVHRFPFYF